MTLPGFTAEATLRSSEHFYASLPRQRSSSGSGQSVASSRSSKSSGQLVPALPAQTGSGGAGAGACAAKCAAQCKSSGKVGSVAYDTCLSNCSAEYCPSGEWFDPTPPPGLCQCSSFLGIGCSVSVNNCNDGFVPACNCGLFSNLCGCVQA
jgi:hypothetical protein